MSLRRIVHRGRRRLAVAVCVALAAALAGTPVDAVEAPAGSRNFSPPSNVPNYYSNESGPFQGGANARTAQPGAGPAYAAPAPRSRIAAASRRIGRHHARGTATARGRYRLARGKAGVHHRQFVHARIVHAGAARSGKALRPRMVQAQPRSARSKAAAVRSRPAPGKGKPVARTRR